MKPRQLLYFLFALALLGCRSESPIASGGSVETTNGISGMIKDSTGASVANAEVLLLESDHNPYEFSKSNLNLSPRSRITDSVGYFHFDKLDQGVYNIESSNPGKGANLIIKNLSVSTAKGVDDLEGLLLAPGKIEVDLSDIGANQEDYIYLPGTTYYYSLTSADINKGKVILENIPVGLYQKIILVRKGVKEGKNLIGSTISVASESTTAIGDLSPWSQKIKVVINTTTSGAGLSENILNYPLLVRLDQAQLQSQAIPIFEASQSRGQDIRFMKSDGITPIKFEIEHWDSANGKAAIWVKLDTVYANDNQQYFLMYTGNREAKSLSQGSAVFDTSDGYTGVWHLGDNASSSTITNSTGVNSGKYHSGNAEANTLTSSTLAGIIGRGLNFNGWSQWVDLGFNQSFVNEAKAVTLSAWVNFRTFGGPQNILSFSESGAAPKISTAQILVRGNRLLELGARSSSLDVLESTLDTIPLTSNTWYQIVGVINFTQDSLHIYVNGQLQSSAQVNFADTISSSKSGGLSTMGSEENGTQGHLTGIMDETSVSKVDRSPSWIKMNYESQRKNSKILELKR